MVTALTNIMGSLGRYGDDMVGHLSHGDVVIPRAIVLEHPEFLTKFKKIMENNQADYRTHVAGSGYENRNPHTGASEFFFSGLKNFFSNPGKQISQAISNPAQTITNSIATSGAILAKPMSDIAATITGSTPYGGFPTSASPTPVVAPPPTPSDLGPVVEEFTPKRPESSFKPYDLFSSSVGGQQFSTLDPTQQRSYLATQGSQGGGIGNEEKDYYLNLLQRNLIDENGQMQNINSALLPVERNYLSTLGLPTGDTLSLLQALQN